MTHLLTATRAALEARNYYAALALALALPDICGWVADPNVGSRARYVQWFDKFMKHHYTANIGADGLQHVFLTGNDFYALRCAYLHEGRDDITDQRAQEALSAFQFTVPPTGLYVHCNQVDNALQLQVDVFCQEVLSGAEDFLSTISITSHAERRLLSLLQIRDLAGAPIPHAA